MKLALLSNPCSHNAQTAISQLLSSFKQQPNSQLNVGYIASEPDPQRQYYSQTQMMYQAHNAQLSVYLELESGFCETSLNALLKCDAIHLSGGDTFRFLKALKQHKLLPVLRQYCVNGGGLIGVSAGAMIITPSIASAPLCGDSNDCQLDDLTGLNLVDFMFVPHATDKQLKQVEQPKQAKFAHPICFCPDDSALLSLSDQLKVFGHLVWQKS
ncbi:Type 1 glutamine amidotransferase-like domain-containing protein [Shewanella fidelis]|uniref:Type 1 glutamine amidotransferase-like domain-containing protein n=1 Tax=Shewanella fidelis TaxID=173509 RepID=A0AAW8NR58_9GAMM|nr:Type 1 glutamine amidotransferase-like domain-containing protein [Shewanella fidelis]MDR8524253.1 Type 1 glutamine amidotransferase-like domain-containing protein [Shewanella fidelis]MDW4813538.1 Type 1 glutamine amidotransferase-like domain-containing protein [Shewanella fidelis]MDW4817539.1 Type 1 glutamine amidotransferase-like domain-containing protein [Shewanella fidelis]MDW4821606.1 Type 1 glutamine amidotransferase-like domain-containing protein [Shewanella fidelis]MDW4825771.1 Type 